MLVHAEEIDDTKEVGESEDVANDSNSYADSSNESTEGSNKTDSDNPQREALKKEFMEKYVKSDCQELPIYDVFESLLISSKVVLLLPVPFSMH